MDASLSFECFQGKGNKRERSFRDCPVKPLRHPSEALQSQILSTPYLEKQVPTAIDPRRCSTGEQLYPVSPRVDRVEATRIRNRVVPFHRASGRSQSLGDRVKVGPANT